MKRFRFTLQSLLQVRMSLEKQQQAELLKAQQFYREQKAKLDGLRDAFAMADKSYVETAQGGTAPENLIAFSRYFEYLKEEINAQQIEVQKALEIREKKQRVLIKTMQDRKVLEKLKEAQLEQYMREVRMEEDKEINDLLSFKTITS